jgi:hypothetical protein
MANNRDSSVENREARYVQGGETDVFENRLGWWERDLETFSFQASDLFVTIAPQYDKRPDRMAFDMYGRSGLQWLILQYNSIVDINEEFRSGKEIRLPDPSRATFSFLNKKTGGVPPSVG